MQKTKWTGTEFKPNETAYINGVTKVTVLYWTKPYGGWWYCQIEQNGGMTYTQLLTKTKIKK
jgi:hypothetical protein